MSTEDITLLAEVLCYIAFWTAFVGYVAGVAVVACFRFVATAVRKRGAAAPWRPRVEAALRRHEFAVRVLRARLERSR